MGEVVASLQWEWQLGVKQLRNDDTVFALVTVRDTIFRAFDEVENGSPVREHQN